jgi:hypothetical protein
MIYMAGASICGCGDDRCPPLARPEKPSFLQKITNGNNLDWKLREACRPFIPERNSRSCTTIGILNQHLLMSRQNKELSRCVIVTSTAA